MVDDQGALWRWQHASADVPAVAFEPLDFSKIAGWDEDDHAKALACYGRSAALSAQKLPVPDPKRLPTLLEDRVKARNFFADNFAAFRVVAEPGLLTSYYEPVLRGSRKRSEAYPVSVYRRPADLVPLPREDTATMLGLTAGRIVNGLFEPYFTRAEIENGALEGRGLELLYLADPIEAFLMHVQGSGRVELDDGSTVRLSFDGKNGHPYTSVARRMVERGDLTVEAAHLDGMVAWLRAQVAPQLFLNENKSYVFFKELEPGEAGPKGSMEVALSQGRSLAVDPRYHPLGTPIFVMAPELEFEGAPLKRLLVAQDTGSAITGPQRGDLFAGSGAAAGAVAGRVRHKCAFIILRPRP